MCTTAAFFAVSILVAVTSSKASHLSLLQAGAWVQPSHLSNTEQEKIIADDIHDEGMGLNVDNANAFQDVTWEALPPEWFHWNHSGFPRSHQGTPTFVDLNGDGVLDYFYHNHYQGQPDKDWDMGISTPDCAFRGKPYYESVGHKFLVLTEPEDSKWKKPEKAMDTHGTAILDIDRDGVLDMYMASGGGEGKVGGDAKNAVLLWGQKTPLGSVPKFMGGRDAAEFSNLANADSRGRMNYFADVNGDGLLDIFYQNEPRADELHVPGYLMINKGRRKFERHDNTGEYSSTMVLTDANGDGNADEYVVQRRDCGIKECTYNLDKTCTKLKRLNSEWYDFCTEHPEGSSAVYKWNHEQNLLQMISPEVHNDTIGADGHALSMQTGDFDHDQKADLAVLMKNSINFYYSSERAPGELPIGAASETLSWNENDCFADTFRVADLDNDGNQEILVLCFHIDAKKGAAHKMYTRWSGAWQEVADKQLLGHFVSAKLAVTKERWVKDLCSNGEKHKGYLNKICEAYRGDQSTGTHSGGLYAPRSMGLSVVDFNNDGFLDVVVAYDIGRMLLLRNNLGSAQAEKKAAPNRFLAIKLVGKRCNEYGIGATVLVSASGMTSSSTVQLREVYAASHETDWLGTKDDRIIFGLGSHGVPEYIEVRWPGKVPHTQYIKDRELLGKMVNSMKNPLIIEESI